MRFVKAVSSEDGVFQCIVCEIKGDLQTFYMMSFSYGFSCLCCKKPSLIYFSHNLLIVDTR